MAEQTFKSTPLYGGAIVCDLPEHFGDISIFRQVPDNQEVWMDKSGFTSIIFEITERVGPRPTGGESEESVLKDSEALTAHLADLVGNDVDSVRVWNTTPTQFSSLEGCPAYVLIATQQPNAPSSKEAGSTAAPDLTAIVLTLLRLEREDTDILITVNVPHIRGEYDEEEVNMELGKTGKLIGDAVGYAGKIWESFKIKDWGLFGEA